MVDLSSIEKAEVLQGLAVADLADLGKIASEQEFQSGDRLFVRGEEANVLYIATRGRFALTVELRCFDGHEEVAIEEPKVLDAFGWSSLVAPHTSIYSGYCSEDGAVVAFPREQLEALMNANRHLGAELMHNLNQLIGGRVRALQKLWLDEVSQSMTRVKRLINSEGAVRWSAAMAGSHSHP